MTGECPSPIGVVGGGVMGAGIAYAFLRAGAQVLLLEADSDAVDAAEARVRAIIRRRSERDRVELPRSAELRVSSDPGDLAGSTLVIEAVPESLALKQEVLGRVQHAAPHSFLATNTSALSVDAIGEALDDPARLIGLHFFNPVPSSALVEIVVGRRTDDGLREQAIRWVESLGKTGIVVSDSPGFASSRLGVALALEAIRMVEEGVASPADIDRAMTLGYRHQTGPLRTTDLVGLDVRLAISRDLERRLGERFAPPALLEEMVEEGRLGRKVGRGFFEWT